ncbi:SDR family NAD(P)-dependent oxidoreductase [Campylobacter sp. MG1]|uniref:SDR family NAD(P)-dependent oxidoreductase n=1 Tax=Campylobacter sp. MG1 TaxID=2976332 RepID=UPI00226CD523|nr:SDR family NAD(P)-dependent oxidoreductase [Campylobacter sp. MG1]
MKTAFITGASSGFGRACAIKLLENGYKVALLARRKEKLIEIANRYKENACVIACDVRNEKEVFNAVLNLPDDFNNIDVLINSAGLALGLNEFHNNSLEDAKTMIETNVNGLVYVTYAILPRMLDNGGHIFNFGSVAANNPYYGGAIYGGTKAFVGQFSLALRNDLRDTNIKVTDIAPGLCKTEFSEVRFKGDIKKADKVYENTKYLSAEDIADTVFSLINLKNHVNINRIELMPQTQTWAGFYIKKDND